MKDRLQFRHHTSIFENRDEAVRYVMNDVRNASEGLASLDNSHGMSLYAEPTVLRYKNEEDESNPHVMLVIGAVTNDGTQYNDNRFTIIDTHKTESELEGIHDDIDKVFKSLSIVTKDTDTLKLYSEMTENGTIISGDVAVAESQILNDVRKPNVILETADGLFTYIDLSYDIDTHVLSFTVNDKTSDFDLGIENFYVEKGFYDRRDESIHLLRNDKAEIVINVRELIDEWGVEGEASNTPIVLTKEEVGYGEEGFNHVEPWQDVLKADIRVLKSKYNILKTTSDNRYLFVDGTAGNITYFKDGKEMSVQDAIDEFTLEVSSDNSNIIYKKPDGLYSSASLRYVSKNNQLVFTTSNVSGGTTEETIQLNSVELFKEIVYDPTTEELLIIYTDSNDTAQTVRVPIGKMMKDWEWDVQNDGHNVKLHKTRNVNGNDKVSADVDIFEGNNNILEDVNHQLYVRGEADNIKYGKDGNVSDELDNLNAFTNDINERLNETSGKVDTVISDLEAEVERATENENRIEKKLDDEISRSSEKDAEHDSEINRLDETIGTGFTTDAHETVTYKFEALSAKTDSLSAKTDALAADLELTEANLQAEIARAKREETRIETKFDNALGDGFDIRNTVKDAIEKETAERKEADAKLQKGIDEVSADTARRLIEVVNKDKSINVNNEDPIRPEISVNLSKEIEDGKENIIKLNADGLYVGVDLEYSFNEENGANQLIFKTTNGTKTFDLKTNSIVDEIRYDSSLEALVVKYTVNGVQQEPVIIPLKDLINEWRVWDGHEGAIQLHKERIHSASTDGFQDVLKADIVVSEHEDNLLINDNGALYVSKRGIVQNASDISDLNDKLDREIERSTKKDDDLQDQIYVLEDTYLINVKDTNTVNINKVRRAKGYELDANVKIDGAEDNIIKATDSGIYSMTMLTYNEETNTLTFENTNGRKDIPLVSNSQIDEVRYDSNIESIVIKYTVNSKKMEDIIVPLRDLIDEVDFASTNSIEITRTRNTAENENVGPDIVTADIKLSGEKSVGVDVFDAKTQFGNILAIKDDGLYATFDVEYIEGEKNNQLVFKTTKGKKVIDLVTSADIQEMTYQKEYERIALKYGVDGETHFVYCDVRDLIDEWDVLNTVDTAVTLKKEKNARENGNSMVDLLSADVKISEAENNILKKLGANSPDGGGTLFVDGSQIEANKNAIEAETNRAIEAETSLRNDLNDEIARATEAEGTLDKKIDAETERATEAETGLRNDLDMEIARATNAEAALDAKIDAETERATAAEEGLRNDLDAEIEARINNATEIKKDVRNWFKDTTSIKWEKGDITDIDKNITAQVKVANSDNNIIVVNGEKDGISASVRLEYEAGKNQLTLITSNGGSQTIQLNSGSIIDKMIYDPVNKSIIITYKGADGTVQELNFPVYELFNEWRVVNPSEDSALELTKKLGEPGEPDELSGRVLLTNLEDNVLTISNNGLYVSGGKMDEALDIARCTSKELKLIEEVLGSTVTGSCEDDSLKVVYPISLDSQNCLLSGATSYLEADLILEKAVCTLLKMMIGSDTASANMTLETEGANQWFEVNVRLSHGNADADKGVGEEGGQSYLDVWQGDDELYIKNYVGNKIEKGYREFTNTNVLRMIDLTEMPPESFGYEPTSWFNGIYLSNYWNCGKYYQKATEAAEIEAMKADGYSNYDKDLTDERPTEQDIFNQRFRNFERK